MESRRLHRLDGYRLADRHFAVERINDHHVLHRQDYLHVRWITEMDYPATGEGVQMRHEIQEAGAPRGN